MGGKWLRYSLVGIISIGILLSLYLGWQRHCVEQANKQVELAVDWEQVKILARREQVSEEEMIKKFRGTVTGIIFKEQTLTDLKNDSDLVIKSGTELSWDITAGNKKILLKKEDGQEDKINLEWNYLIFSSPDLRERVSRHLAAKSPGDGEVVSFNLSVGEKELPVVGTSLRLSDLAAIGVGFEDDDLKLAASSGFNLIPQVRSWPFEEQENAAGIDLVFEGWSRLPISAFFFNDSDLPGVGLPPAKQNQVFKDLAGRISALHIPVGMVEFFPQKGLAGVARYMEKNVVRLHAIPEDEMSAMSQSRAVDRFTLAATDRNIRVLLVRFFPQMGWYDNLNYLKEVHQSLEAEGFSFGKSAPLASLPFSRLYLLVLAAGVAAGGILLLMTLGYEKTGLTLGILGLLGFAVLIVGGQVSLARKGLALIGTVIFPVLSVTVHLKESGKSIPGSIWVFLRMTLVSLIGAVFLVGLLADRTFMYGLDRFAGVKLAHVLPLLLVLLIFWFAKERGRHPLAKVMQVLDHPVTVKYVVLLGFLGLVLLIYVMRTGNENAAVSAWELAFRAKLENLLAVRPRTKEFLIGHPLMLLMIYLGYRDRYLPLLLVATIGQVSVVNTFAHIHTPVVISLIRTFNGVWLGILLGLILIAGYLVLVRAGAYLQKRMLER